MRSATAIIIGAGHSGLAMSWHLTARSIDHVVLERGEVANSWRTERWDSLRLLTPNWQSRLPGHAYAGEDPDGFMTMSEVVHFLQHYAELSRAPVMPGVRVTRVRRDGGGLRAVDKPGSVALPPAGDREWGVQPRFGPVAERRSARHRGQSHAHAVPAPRSPAGWRRHDRRRLGERHSARP